MSKLNYQKNLNDATASDYQNMHILHIFRIQIRALVINIYI